MKLTCLWISYLRYCTRIMYMVFFFLFSLDLILHPIYYFLQRASTILVHQTFHPSHLSNSSKSHSTHFKIIILFLFFLYALNHAQCFPGYSSSYIMFLFALHSAAPPTTRNYQCMSTRHALVSLFFLTVCPFAFRMYNVCCSPSDRAGTLIAM